MQNINLSLCNITREAINLDKEKLIPGVTLVTSGVVEIAKLQSQGFSYLKVQ
jgi:intracellular sulfur oxidation DsrE/DsrF family protein